MDESTAGATHNVLCAFAITPNKLGGREQFAIEIARQLKPLGRQLILCFEGDPSPRVREALLAPGNLTLEVLPKQAAIDLAGAMRFEKLLLRYRPEAMLYALGGVVRLWPMLARANGVQRILYNDGTSRTNMNYRAGKAVQLLMKPLTGVVCVSQFVKICSDREAIIPAEKTTVLYNSADIERQLGDGAEFRRRHGIPADRIVVLKVSWLIPEKGIDVALLAAKEALKERSDLHFLFCGDGKDRKIYERMAEDQGMGDHVTWAGQVEDMGSSGAFQAADMQIQCSQWQEAFCLSVAEGMAAGLPVIVAKIGGLPELVTEGENGYLFDPQNYQSLAASILKLAGDKELRQRMGRDGREKAIERHNLKKNVAKWIEMLMPKR
jgi:glycosyltransferase involved in cell wall biosynthesis